MNLEDIMPSKIRQSQKEKYFLIPFIRVTKIVIEAESRIAVAKDWREEEMRSCKSTGRKFELCKINKF